jgi:hypothetical protein
MTDISREMLHAYLDDALSDSEMSRVEQAVRSSESVRKALLAAMQERDRGDHTLGAIWRRERLTCPSREQLSSYLLQVLDDDVRAYVAFHLETVACRYCLANLHDLEALQREPAPEAKARRRRIFTSSADLLQGCRDGPEK